MTRFVVDAPVMLRLVRAAPSIPAEHSLVAPALLKSQVLQLVYDELRSGEVERREAVAVLDRFATTKVRYLSDRVSRAVALQIAEELGETSTAAAEYLAVTRLQADAFITLDADLARRAEGVVPLAELGDLTGPTGLTASAH